jgi:hypothetical protein
MSDDIRDLIERGSLGTPEAKALRAQTSDADVARVMARVRHLERVRDTIKGHWLVFVDQSSGGPITGCHCGFESNFEDACGWGDDVIEHIALVAIDAWRHAV